jgi:hypothetical protein
MMNERTEGAKNSKDKIHRKGNRFISPHHKKLGSKITNTHLQDKRRSRLLNSVLRGTQSN